jgi:hypothetical protein
MATTIATVTALHSNDIFIRPHFRCLSGVNKRYALIGRQPWPLHAQEHGVSPTIGAEKILKKEFPDVEIIYTDKVVDSLDTMVQFYNLFPEIASDFDYVTRFDSDMLFTQFDWQYMIKQIGSHNAYQMNFKTNTINYYVDFDHGLMDAQERDIMIISTKHRFDQMSYFPDNSYMMEWPGWMCHHFRGWNKPTTTTDFFDTEYYKQHSQAGVYTAPLEIRELFK